MNETSASAIAIVRTSMPYVDRRSLSEAWFSAFHPVVQEPARAQHGSRANAPAIAQTKSARPQLRAHARAIAGYPSPAISNGSALSRRGEPAANASGRTADIRSSRVVSRAVAVCDRSYPARRTSLTLGVGRERVALVLRREGPVLHVIAVCRPDVAPLVRRALARADAYVRGSGDSLRASVRTTADGAVRA